MRLLIANHIDFSLLRQVDQRTFTQRLFWLAREGDVIVLSAPPDDDFLCHVTTLLGIRKDRLTIVVAPPGRYEGRLFDPLSLASVDLVECLLPLVKECSELVCLWPSVQVAQLAARLQIEHAMPGAHFFSQGGDALANSKATFRAFAAACGTPMAQGTVCRTIEELALAVSTLLKEVEGVMIKQAHNGAGAGNQIIRVGADVGQMAGARYTRRIDALSELDDMMLDLWRWASAGDRFPVVVEEFRSNCRTIYFEFKADNSQVTFAAAGGLEYEEGKLVREHTPLAWDIPESILRKGKEDAQKLAEIYRASGYRGYMSADAILDARGELLFTEMNARIGGSPHVYAGIWGRVVKRSERVDRHVVQYLTPPRWKLLRTREVLESLARAGVLYDHDTRTGAMLGMPPHPEIGSGTYLLCLVTRSGREQRELFERINLEFNGVGSVDAR